MIAKTLQGNKIWITAAHITEMWPGDEEGTTCVHNIGEESPIAVAHPFMEMCLAVSREQRGQCPKNFLSPFEDLTLEDGDERPF